MRKSLSNKEDFTYFVFWVCVVAIGASAFKILSAFF